MALFARSFRLDELVDDLLGLFVGLEIGKLLSIVALPEDVLGPKLATERDGVVGERLFRDWVVDGQEVSTDFSWRAPDRRGGSRVVEEAKAMAVLVTSWRRQSTLKYLMLATQIVIGLRFSELRALEKRDLDLQARVSGSAARSYARRCRRPRTAAPGSTSSRAISPRSCAGSS